MRHLTSLLQILLVAFVLSMASSGIASAQSSLEIFQDKILALEEGLKDVRNIIEEDFRELKLSLQDKESLGGGDVESINNKIGKLVDQMGALGDQIERTLQTATDNEFRLLRLEKRIESIMRMGIEGSLASGPDNQGAGEAPAASLNASGNNQSNWTIDEESLENELSKLPNTEDALSETASEAAAVTPLLEDEGTTAVAAVEGEDGSSVLPNAAPDEQYRFALGKALQNDLDIAELALDEFVQLNPEHERANDATFWLGRVQFMKSSYEKAAITFTSFNSQWPTDARREKTTLWIAESISYFAPTNEVCELLVSLPNLLDDPTDTFYERLEKLKTKAACSG